MAINGSVKIGVLGSDHRAAAMERLLGDAGYTVWSGDVMVCDVLIFAGKRGETDDIVSRLGEIGSQTIVVDAMAGPFSNEPDAAAAFLSGKFEGKRIVRALIAQPRPGSHALIYGKDPNATKLAAGIFRDAGCVTTEINEFAGR